MSVGAFSIGSVPLGGELSAYVAEAVVIVPDAIKELILKNIVSTLEGITTNNGYPIDLLRVLRVPSSPFDFPEFPFAIVVDTGEDKTEGSPATKTACLMHLVIAFWNNEWHSVSERAIQIGASIEKALGVDPTRGGYAIDTDVIGNDLMLADESLPFGGGNVRVDILYRHQLRDPHVP